MEPNKFEKHIKKQLQKREIRPSADAWERISEQLDSPKEAKNNKFLWYAVAANFIGILIISITYFSSEKASIMPDAQIVDTQKEEQYSIQKDISSESKNEIEEPLNAIKNDPVAGNENSDQELGIPNEEALKKHIDTPKPELVAVAERVEVKEKKVNELLSDSEETINLKIAEVAAQVEILEMNSDALTEAEVDSLLRKAQKEILEEKLFNPDKSIDAIALLNEVEDELDQSFRDQIFETLKNGFLKVRTAVADRNN